MKRRLVWALLGVLVVALLGAAGAALWLQARLEQPYRGYEAAEQFVEISRGAGAARIADELVRAGIVRDRWLFRIALWRADGTRRLQAGEYRFVEPLTPQQAIDKLIRGDVYLRPITFREGLTLAEMAAVFEAGGFGSADEFLAAARRVEYIRDLDNAATDLEGYLFPETYALARDATADQLVRAMVERFKQSFDHGLRTRAAARNLSVREAVTLASLVEKETAVPEERPLVAAVFANRLRLGMGLQCDPTVIYALQREGRFDGNLRRADLDFDSPYNTYRRPGLPPGPIAAPGRGALEAAVNPADVGYLYFVSRNDGSHVFATSLREHNRNVQEFQIRYFREKRRRERLQAAPGRPDGTP